MFWLEWIRFLTTQPSKTIWGNFPWNILSQFSLPFDEILQKGEKRRPEIKLRVQRLEFKFLRGRVAEKLPQFSLSGQMCINPELNFIFDGCLIFTWFGLSAPLFLKLSAVLTRFPNTALSKLFAKLSFLFLAFIMFKNLIQHNIQKNSVR